MSGDLLSTYRRACQRASRRRIGLVVVTRFVVAHWVLIWGLLAIVLSLVLRRVRPW